jgi:cbb3-type cytochrome oxidase maturation protein
MVRGMSVLIYLIPVALFLGLLGLAGFLWALRSGQFDDLDGAAHRILLDDEERPLPPPGGRKDPGSSDEEESYRPTVSR